MRTLKVLIADADGLLQRLYSDLIAEESSFTVVKCVSSGTQMFETMRCVDVDLVLLDLYIKDFSVLEGLDRLRHEFPHTDYIIASSGDDPDIVRKALCLGVFEYLIKPFSFNRLRQALRNYRVYNYSLTSRTSPWQQEDIDSLISMKRRDISSGENRCIPKGLQLKCLNDIELLLKETGETFSASEVGTKVGISRSTARRYLEFLMMNERVGVEYAYRKVGRPEKRYHIALV